MRSLVDRTVRDLSRRREAGPGERAGRDRRAPGGDAGGATRYESPGLSGRERLVSDVARGDGQL